MNGQIKDKSLPSVFVCLSLSHINSNNIMWCPMFYRQEPPLKPPRVALGLIFSSRDADWEKKWPSMSYTENFLPQTVHFCSLCFEVIDQAFCRILICYSPMTHLCPWIWLMEKTCLYLTLETIFNCVLL